MEFKIMEKPLESKYKDCFVVEIEVMHGDADGYETLEVSGFKKDCEKSKVHMVDLVETLERMKAAYPNGRCGYDTYNHVEGFKNWFIDEKSDEFRERYENLEEWEQRFYWNDWPYGHGYDIQGSIEDYSVFYYDESGVKYEVSVIK